MARRPYSLRLQLLALISVPIIIAGTVVGALSLYFTYHEIDEIYDVQLVHAAKLLHDLTRNDLTQPGNRRIEAPAPHSGIAHYYEQKISFRVWQDDRLIAESLSAGDLESTVAPPGFSKQLINDTEWHFFVHVDEASNITVEVAEHAEVRTELILQILGSLLLPGLIFIPVMLLLIWFGVTRGLQPMLALARQVNRRGAADLTPLTANYVPREIAPFITAINHLFARVDRALRTEREFTDNAAHELRTPLAAMKTQAQVLRKVSHFHSADREGVDNLLVSIDRATRMIEQLLTFSRLQHIEEDFETIDLGTLCREALHEISPLVLKRKQHLKQDIAPGVRITGSATALGVMIRNLVDNASKHSPDGSDIGVSVRMENHVPVLTVSDQGPGIAPEFQERVFERFYRVVGADNSGSGLGLAMVRWVVEQHQAEIAFENLLPHGLRVRISFRSD